MDNKVTKRERGWPGHFIGGHDCTYTRNTLLTYNDIKIVVSSVGMYHPVSAGDKFDTLNSAQSYYETMAFHADPDSPHSDADISRQICIEHGAFIKKIEWMSNVRADEMHEKAVEEVTNKLISGELKDV